MYSYQIYTSSDIALSDGLSDIPDGYKLIVDKSSNTEKGGHYNLDCKNEKARYVAVKVTACDKWSNKAKYVASSIYEMAVYGRTVQTVTPEPTETPTPTVTPEVTEKPVATGTPEPTGTPEATEKPEATSSPEPTATPEQTNTPEPTNTPKPTGTPEPIKTPKPLETLISVKPPIITDTSFNYELNTDDTVLNYDMYIALYKADGTLLGVMMNKSKGEFNVAADKDWTLKVMLWEKNTMKPVGNAITYTPDDMKNQ